MLNQTIYQSDNTKKKGARGVQQPIINAKAYKEENKISREEVGPKEPADQQDTAKDNSKHMQNFQRLCSKKILKYPSNYFMKK